MIVDKTYVRNRWIPDFAEIYGTSSGETLYGGRARFGSHIFADDGEDVVYAGGGTDTVYGGKGNDRLFGEAGDDWLHGQSGHDHLDGGTGADTLIGSDGNDTYVVDNVLDRVFELPDFSISPTTDFSRDTIISSVDVTMPLPDNVENLILTGDALIGVGNAADNEITGNSNWGSILEGRDGDDVITGGDMHGDIIVGGNGRDGLWGKDGADIFVWSSTAETGPNASERDRIKNFSPLEGDRIFLMGIDADETTPGHQQFTFIGPIMTGENNGGSAVGGFAAPGQLGFEYDASSHDLFIWLNTDGDDAPEAGITLGYASPFIKGTYTGDGIPDADWFIL